MLSSQGLTLISCRVQVSLKCVAKWWANLIQEPWISQLGNGRCSQVVSVLGDFEPDKGFKRWEHIRVENMVRKRWGANLFTWNWKRSAVDPIHACSKTMQNSEAAYVHCPTCRPADLDPVPTFFEDLVTLEFENPSSFDENYDCSSKQKNWIKPSQLTQALRLGFKIPSLFNHSTPKSCPFSFCLDFSYPLNSWWFDTPALPPLTWMLPRKAQEFEGF